MRAKHTRPRKHLMCCGKEFSEDFALDDHYRGSPRRVHPNCTKCGKGFKGAVELDFHFKSTHKTVLCAGAECNETLFEEDLSKHYTASSPSKHPKCPRCKLGLLDSREFSSHLREHKELEETQETGRQSTVTASCFSSVTNEQGLGASSWAPWQDTIIPRGSPPSTSMSSSTVVGAGRVTAVSPQLPVYRFSCRMCQSDPCKEPMATACGHLFCNGCVQLRIEKSEACPVCLSPLLAFKMKLEVCM